MVSGWCSRSWTDINIDFTNNSVKHCCKALSEPIINSYNNNPNILQRRKDSFNNIKNVQCKSCWDEYDNYGSAFRDYWNEWTSLDDFDDDWKYLQVKFDNICNLSCIYCNAVDSSRIAAEKDIKINNLYNDQSKRMFYQWIQEENINNKLISILGGEPTISSNVLDFIEFLSKTKYNDMINLNINTNGVTIGILKDRFFNLINNLPKSWIFTIVISNESTTRSPLIRYGLDTNIFWQNFEWYATSPNVNYVGLNPCLSKFSVKEIADYLERCCEIVSKSNKNFWIHGNTIETPKELCISSLAKKYVDYIYDAKSIITQYSYLFEKNNLQQIYLWLDACKDKILCGDENSKSDNYITNLANEKHDFKLKDLCI